VLKKAIPYVDSLTLSYRDTVFSLEFAALSYANSQKNRYRYKLENFDSGWNEVDSNQRVATYTNLDAGRYVFRVQGSNSDGAWNEQGVSLAILITPPWWKTTWFRALCLLIFCALLWAGHHLRVNQFRREERKLREAIESIPAMAWITGPDGKPEFVNRRWNEYTGGLPLVENPEQARKEAVHPED
jgi:PAS domain-containing protein